MTLIYVDSMYVLMLGRKNGIQDNHPGEAAGIAQQIAQAAIEKELGIEREKK